MIIYCSLQDIKSQIILEYNENNNNNSFQDKKQRYSKNNIDSYLLNETN